jgi:glucose-6-phosphate isomerase
MQPEEWYKPDLRALIHWQPQIVTDSLGKAQTSFYNADNLDKVQIVVEAISENGEIGYQELFYEVTKNLKNKQANDFNRNQTTIQH